MQIITTVDNAIWLDFPWMLQVSRSRMSLSVWDNFPKKICGSVNFGLSYRGEDEPWLSAELVLGVAS